jgi:hypothetical protein
MATSDAAGQRHLGGFVKAKQYPAVVDRWAVIVGISKYCHSKWTRERILTEFDALVARAPARAGALRLRRLRLQRRGRCPDARAVRWPSWGSGRYSTG